MHFCLRIAEEALVIDKGMVVHRQDTAGLSRNEDIRRRYLAIVAAPGRNRSARRLRAARRLKQSGKTPVVRPKSGPSQVPSQISHGSEHGFQRRE